MNEDRLSPARKTGLPPGTAIYIGAQRTSPITLALTSYSPDAAATVTVTDEVPAVAAKSGTVKWLDVAGLHDVPLIEEIGRRFNLHPLTVEDILNTTSDAD